MYCMRATCERGDDFWWSALFRRPISLSFTVPELLGGKQMADLSEYVPPALTHIFPLVLGRMLYKSKISKLNYFNIGI